MTNSPLVSVCIPVYNGGAFIGQAISSVLEQTYKHTEVVVLDNASNDDTLEVIASFTDSRLRVETNETTSGAGANWNRALLAARGEYVKLLSADDFLYPTCIQRQVDAFTGANGVVLVCSPRDIVDESGRRIMTRGLRRAGRMPGALARRAVVRSGTNPLGETASALMRTDVAQSIGGFDESDPYTIDVEFWMRLLQSGDLCVVAEPLSAYRVSGGSWSVSVAGAQAAHYRRMLKSLEVESDSDLSRLDFVRGRLMASLNGFARQILYSMRRKPGVAGTEDGR